MGQEQPGAGEDLLQLLFVDVLIPVDAAVLDGAVLQDQFGDVFHAKPSLVWGCRPAQARRATARRHLSVRTLRSIETTAPAALDRHQAGRAAWNRLTPSPAQIIMTIIIIFALRSAADVSQPRSQILTTYSFYRGTDWFGAKSDNDVNQAFNINNNAKLQFTKYSIDSNLMFYFPDPTYQLNSNIHLQYSDDFLYDNDKLRIGGHYSVRGYSSSYYGNNGWYINNNLLKSFTPAFSTTYLQSISPFFGIDYGEIQCQSDNVGSCGKMVGSAVGFKTDAKMLSTEFTWSRAIKKVSDQKLENLFRYSLTLKF